MKKTWRLMPWRLPVLSLAMLILLTGCAGDDLDWQGTDITGVMPDLAFELTREDGEAVSADAFEGTSTLLFFGWTYCPDVCPVTLQSIKQAMDSLPEEQRDALRVLFVSVDPKRDTPERLAEYTSTFGPRFVGLTGTEGQLTELTKRFRATYGYGEADASGAYEVSHSMAIYGFDAQGQARVLMKNNQPTDALAADLSQLSTL